MRRRPTREDLGLSLVVFEQEILKRERDLEPVARKALALLAIFDAGRAYSASASMAAEARRLPQIRNELREARELAAVGPHIEAAAKTHGLEVAVLLNPNRKDRRAVAAKDEAKSRSLAAGIPASAIGRVMGCGHEHIKDRAERHEAKVAAAAAGKRKGGAHGA